jgi:mannose-1-phosphate guanylyltransferase
MKNFGQPWALVLAPGDNDSDVDAPSAFAALLRGVLNRAAAFADRAHIWAVVTQQRRQRLEGPLWFVPASSFVVLPEHGSTTYGILMGLMRIAQRDPAARIVVLPSSYHVGDEKPLIRSLRYAAAHTVLRPDDLFILGAQPEVPDPELPGIVVGPDDHRGAFQVAQLIDKSAAAPRHAVVGRRLLWNTGILAGSIHAFLRLMEGRIPHVVVEAQAVIRGADPDAAAELNTRLLGLDFHRHVLSGQERHLTVLPVPSIDLGASERVADQQR